MASCCGFNKTTFINTSDLCLDFCRKWYKMNVSYDVSCIILFQTSSMFFYSRKPRWVSYRGGSHFSQCNNSEIVIRASQAYSKPNEISKMEHFVKTTNRWKVVNYFCKKLHFVVWQNSEYVSNKGVVSYRK